MVHGGDCCGSCFPSNATVCTPEGYKPIRDVQLGDRILARNGKGEVTFSTVCHLTHNQPGVPIEVVTLTTETGASLELSPGHYIAKVDKKGILSYVLARTIQPGDSLRLCTAPDEDDLVDAVTAVTMATASGKHALLTMEGNHFINGVLCSNYEETVPPSWAHRPMGLLRQGYRLCPSAVSCLNSWVTMEGIPKWASLAKNYLVPLLPLPTPAS